MLYEIWTLGKDPYQGIPNSEVYHAITDLRDCMLLCLEFYIYLSPCHNYIIDPVEDGIGA